MWQVGGGPTGVELAAEMHDYIKEDLVHLFPTLKVLPPLLLLLLLVSCYCLDPSWKLLLPHHSNDMRFSNFVGGL